jgi:uncharacterized protein with PIN domain
MIAVDTSALMAIVLDEVEAGACIAALKAEHEILISAGTIAEALIVAARRNVRAEMLNERTTQSPRGALSLHETCLRVCSFWRGAR